MPLVSLKHALFELGTGDPNESIPGTRTSGPQGIEAIIQFNGLFLNVRDWIDTYLVTTILGIDDADVRDSRDVNPGRDGETPGIAVYGGRTISLQGKIQTRTVWKTRDMILAMRAAFADISQEMPLIFHGAQPDNDLMVYCKKSQKLDIPETQTTLNSFERSFNITLRASDPTFMSVNRRYESWTAAGSSYDDIVYFGLNNGNYPAKPLIELTGPMNGVVLINELNGNVIEFTQNIPSGHIWAIDMTGPQPRIYDKGDNTDLYEYVSGVSTDVIYMPNALNPIRLTATGLTGASHVDSWVRDTLM